MTEYSGSAFKAPGAKFGARDLLNEIRSPMLCSLMCDGAINLSASLGHQECATHTR